MADVEQPAFLADRVVLGGDPGGVLDRHFEAGEGDHLGAERDVDVVEGSAFQHGEEAEGRKRQTEAGRRKLRARRPEIDEWTLSELNMPRWQWSGASPRGTRLADARLNFRSGSGSVTHDREPYAAVDRRALPCCPSLAVQARQQRPPVRLLGVFDAATGEPVTGAEVVDLGTARGPTTSVSGAISLAFLQPGPTILQIRKVGNTSRMVTVAGRRRTPRRSRSS